ncbi:MAG: L-asparaginase [Myxococcaceae bacterium]|nr:L-asparaginase [Myxococcaceae bacterium]
MVMPDDAGASWGTGPARWSILVHGGAGDVSPALVGAHVAGCERAVAEAAQVLAAGGSALEAVQRAVEVLESDPLFNAGTGACLDSDGHLALDAAIMDGNGLRAGGVCALPAFEHPIAIARRVMEETAHVLLAAEGAARFAIAQGFVPADEAKMITDAARKKWEAARAKGTTEGWAGGTVGAVARDVNGHVAAATSTGGMVNKLAGRVGDSPIIGAGTYADDEAGACSTTGHGEAMIRVCVAKTAVDGMRPSLTNDRDTNDASGTHVTKTAAQTSCDAIALMQRRTAQTGGLIVVAPDGSLGLARTTRTMTWASANDAGTASGC